MICMRCASRYGISDGGPFVVDNPFRLRGIDNPDPTYNYADGLCIECHTQRIKMRQPDYDEDDIPF